LKDTEGENPDFRVYFSGTTSAREMKYEASPRNRSNAVTAILTIQNWHKKLKIIK
jgi:hypothetical protein